MEREGTNYLGCTIPGFESIPLLITEASKIRRLRNIY